MPHPLRVALTSLNPVFVLQSGSGAGLQGTALPERQAARGWKQVLISKCPTQMAFLLDILLGETAGDCFLYLISHLDPVSAQLIRKACVLHL